MLIAVILNLPRINPLEKLVWVNLQIILHLL